MIEIIKCVACGQVLMSNETMAEHEPNCFILKRRQTMSEWQKQYENETRNKYEEYYIPYGYLEWLESKLDEENNTIKNLTAEVERLNIVLLKIKGERECPKEGCENYITNITGGICHYLCGRAYHDHFTPAKTDGIGGNK